MNKLKCFSILLLVLALLMPTDIFALSKKKKRKKVKYSPVISYVHGYAGAGYSTLLNNLNKDEISNPGGGAAVLGFGYTLKHRKNPFIFKTGLEFMYMSSNLKLDPFRYVGTFKYSDDNIQDYDIDYNMDFEKYVESQNRFGINVPIMVGAQFKSVYFTVGAKAMTGLVNTYGVRTKLTTTAKDPEFVGGFEDMPNHTFKTSKPRYSSKLNLSMIDVSGSAEFGVILDKWMPREMTKIRNKRKTKLSYRAGLFADYGILNLNKSVPGQNDALINIEGAEQIPGDDGFIAPAENIHNVAPRSVFNSSKGFIDENETKLASLNSLVIGAKFEVMVQVSKDPPKRKKRRPRPKPRKPRPSLPDPPYFFAVVLDYETESVLEADLKLFKLDETADTVFAATTDAETGFTETRIKSDRFGLIVTKPGYISYVDTVFQIDNDTLFVELQPIRENTIVILENLLFETAKTEVKNKSTKSLDEMYQLLVENPGLKIEITGHTDDVGSARYNRRLSEGRAKSVYQIMVDRGIDPDRMTWRGAGENEPIDTNDTPEGRAENRRVEFMITANDDAYMIFKSAKEEEQGPKLPDAPTSEKPDETDGKSIENLF